MSLTADGLEDKRASGPGTKPKGPARLVLKRLCVLFSVMYFLSLSLWVSGNARFLDATQSLLLVVFSVDSILLAFCAACGLLVLILPPLRKREAEPGSRGPLPSLAAYFFLILLGVFGVLFGDSILTLAGGLR